MTREEFEAGYAAGSGTTVAHLRRLGRMAVPCACDSSDCPGWQMLYVGSLLPEELEALPEPFQSEARELQTAINWRDETNPSETDKAKAWMRLWQMGQNNLARQWRPPWPRRLYLWFRYLWPVRKACNVFSLACYALTGYCGYGGCGYTESYGFVPEADCPIHDSDSHLSRWARKARRGRERSPWQLAETKKEKTK